MSRSGGLVGELEPRHAEQRKVALDRDAPGGHAWGLGLVGRDAAALLEPDHHVVDCSAARIDDRRPGHLRARQLELELIGMERAPVFARTTGPNASGSQRVGALRTSNRGRRFFPSM